MSEVRQDLGGWSILTRTSFNLSNPWVSVNFLGSSCNQQLGDRHLVVLLLFQAYPPINWWKFTSWRGKKVDRVEYPRVGVQLWVFTTNLSLHFFSRGPPDLWRFLTDSHARVHYVDLVKGAKSFISISWGACRHSCKWRPTIATFEMAKTPRINFVGVLNDSFFDNLNRIKSWKAQINCPPGTPLETAPFPTNK